MTAREFQAGLPAVAVAYRVAEVAGISRRTWQTMVYREQVLSADHLASLADALVQVSAEIRDYGADVRPAEGIPDGAEN